MRVDIGDLSGVKLVDLGRHADERGFFAETYRVSRLAELGIDDRFVQDNRSYSAVPGTVRGLHFQAPPHAQAKLVRVSRGAIFDVVVDIRQGSRTYGDHAVVRLDAAHSQQLYVPVGFAHGICTLEPETEVEYKVTAEYAPREDRGLLWNDPALGIAWPVAAAEAKLSQRDATHPRLGELPPYFTIEASNRR